MKHSLWIVLLLLLAAAPVAGQTCDCKIGFPLTPSTVTVDGVINEMTEYSGAFVLDTAANPACLKQLYDWVGGSPTTDHLIAKAVKVFARRDDAGNLYLAFRIKDSTQTGLVPGERVIVQIDPDGSRGTQLSNGAAASQKDYRFEVAHLWSTGAGGALSFSEQKFWRSTLAPGLCMKQRWELNAAFPAGVQVAGHNDGSGAGGGYSIEMMIPLTAIGLGNIGVESSLGVSFAIVNDLGTGCPEGACEATATSFPATIPVNNVDTPLAGDDLAECQGWLVPDAWATAFFGSTAPVIEIKRDPVWWSATSVEAFPCNAEVSTYTYFKVVPCKLRVRARIENTGQGGASRNVLFLWGEPGIGQTNWRFIDLQKNVTVPGGGGFFTSATWNNVPAGLGGHPCVRVYVLPASFLPAFDEARMTNTSGTLDPNYIADLESTYGTGTQCMAQKNLNEPVNDSCMTCPVQSGLSSPFVVFAQTAPFPFSVPSDEGRLMMGKTVAQIEAFGKAPRQSGVTNRYNFIEPIGGAVQLITAAMLGNPINLVIGNPQRFAQAVFTSVVARDPDGRPVNMTLDFRSGTTLQPHEEKRVTFNTGMVSKRCFGCFGSTSSTALLLLVGGLVPISRRAWRS
jgi:hypothetical protein